MRVATLIQTSCLMLLSVLSCAMASADTLTWIRKPSLVFENSSQTGTVEFELSALTDVEVAIMNAEGKLVRHLAAGVLGKNPPPPLQADAKAQVIAWDGKDDFGEAADGGPFHVRVRAGMGVKLDRIVGGNPYAWYSRDMNSGNHAMWRIAGLEQKSDGSVYIMGNVTHAGPPAIRQYDADGEYIRTVYPPPAGKPFDQMNGWGAVMREDGSYTFRYRALGNPSITTSAVVTGWRGQLGNLVPSPHRDKLVVFDSAKRSRFNLLTINADGTIPSKGIMTGRLINNPETEAEEGEDWRLSGPFFSCLAPDRKHLYLSGVFARSYMGSRPGGSVSDGFWRDGQLFKLDIETGTAGPFFALDNVPTSSIERNQVIGGRFSHSALHGVAAIGDHVFLCDRVNRRVVVLDQNAKIVREVPVDYPDAVAVSAKTHSMYVTTRQRELKLLKFDDWRTSSRPSVEIALCQIRSEHQNVYVKSYLLAHDSADGTRVWVAFHGVPVQIYRDGEQFELLKDFYEIGAQRCLDFPIVGVDRTTEGVYVGGSFNALFRLADWRNPKLVRCRQRDETFFSLSGGAFCFDARRRRIFGCAKKTFPISPYKIDGPFITPDFGERDAADISGPQAIFSWKIGYGLSTFGFGLSPDGHLGVLNRGNDSRNISIEYYKPDSSDPLWSIERFADRFAGTLAFDLNGNLYAGAQNRAVDNVPAGFQDDKNFSAYIGQIYKFTPTGPSLKNLYPTAPKGPARTYNVHYGDIGTAFFRRPARFAVDDFGRILYPNSLAAYVGMVDNEGNEILRFGTYGNRDSMGGLDGDLVPTQGIPMAFPKSVDASDDYIYVGDQVNCRMLRIKKTFELVSHH